MSVKLFSKLDYTVTIPYGDDSLPIPPFARNYVVPDESKLGKLPMGITKIEIKDKKKKGDK